MSISIAEITARSQENGDWDNLAPEGFVKNELGFNIPEDGWTGEVDAIAVRFGTTKNGNPSVGIQCRDLVTERKFWANLYYSDSDDANQIVIANLSAWGATPELIAGAIEVDEDPNEMNVQSLKTVGLTSLMEPMLGKPKKGTSVYRGELVALA